MLKKFKILLIIVLMLSMNTVFAEEIGKKQSELTGLGSGIWKINTIPVCWENPETENNKERIWTKDSVEDTWERHSLIRFINWDNCKSNSQGIRIKIEDSGPHVKAIGSHIDGIVNGMVLNFTFDSWSSSCKNNLEYCIKVVAVHEFGHALGFTHEQNRPDAPNECRKEMQGTTGDILITPYDLKSVMNYCNPEWSGNGKLSQFDIQGLKDWYNNPIKLGLPTWRYSSAGVSKWENINTSGVHINNLRFGDFDGDGKDDVFTSSNGKWKVSFSGVTRWKIINSSEVSIVKLRVGDFDGDGKDDIFTSSNGKWKVSFSGTSKWKEINSSGVHINNLRFGDFDGDGKDDIFTSSNEKWKVSFSGTSKWEDINSSGVSINNLRIGDFNGDGKDDIFTSSNGKWKVSFSGTSKWEDINSSGVTMTEIRFADIDGDKKTDVFTSTK